MDQRIQFHQLLWIVEDDCRELSAVDPAIWTGDFRAELVDHAFVRLTTGLDDLMAQFIGANQEATKFRQGSAHKTLAAGEAASEARAQHTLCNTLVALGKSHRVCHQHRYGQRPHAAGHGRIGAGNACGVERMNVPDQRFFLRFELFIQAELRG